MTGLTWLNDLMTWLAKWVPRLVLISAGNEGVLFGPGGKAIRKASGLCCYWPITHDLTIVSTRQRSVENAAQLHGRESISLVVLFRIVDPMALMLTVNDVFSLIDDRSQAHLSIAYAADKTDFAITAIVLAGLQAEFEHCGVEIMRVDVAQRGWTIPIKMLSDYAQHSESKL